MPHYWEVELLPATVLGLGSSNQRKNSIGFWHTRLDSIEVFQCHIHVAPESKSRDWSSRMVKRPIGSDGEASSPNCGASAGVKARHLIQNHDRRKTPKPANNPLMIFLTVPKA